MIKQEYISFSGGVESTAMCVLYGKGAKAIWCDTGSEHPEMYERMNYVEERLKEIHKGDFELIRIKPSVNCKGKKVDSLTEYIQRSGYMPSKRQRFCTANFKIEPIDQFLANEAKGFTDPIRAKYNALIGLARQKEKHIIRMLQKRMKKEFARIKCNELMIGFNADEEPQAARVGNYMQNPNTLYTYPLYEAGLTREDCEDILNIHGLHPNMPIYMKRGGV